MSTPHHPVAIIGGGLGGLTLARVLHVNGIGAAVFEPRSEETARESADNLEMMFSDRAPKALVDMFASFSQQ